MKKYLAIAVLVLTLSFSSSALASFRVFVGGDSAVSNNTYLNFPSNIVGTIIPLTGSLTGGTAKNLQTATGDGQLIYLEIKRGNGTVYYTGTDYDVHTSLWATDALPIVHGLALFSATNTHAITGSAFVGQTASVVQTTLFGVSPVLEIVAGLILGFLIIRFLINLFKEVDTKKEEPYVGFERRGYHSDGKGGVIKNDL